MKRLLKTVPTGTVVTREMVDQWLRDMVAGDVLRPSFEGKVVLVHGIDKR